MADLNPTQNGAGAGLRDLLQMPTSAGLSFLSIAGLVHGHGSMSFYFITLKMPRTVKMHARTCMLFIVLYTTLPNKPKSSFT